MMSPKMPTVDSESPTDHELRRDDHRNEFVSWYVRMVQYDVSDTLRDKLRRDAENIWFNANPR